MTDIDQCHGPSVSVNTVHTCALIYTQTGKLSPSVSVALHNNYRRPDNTVDNTVAVIIGDYRSWGEMIARSSYQH